MTISLPKIDAPIYTLTLPSTEKEIKYRPFLVKEEKVLLAAMEHGDSDSDTPNTQLIVDSLKSVLENCTFNKLNIDDLTEFDLEYLLINLIEKSKGPITPLTFRCNNVVKKVDDEGYEYDDYCGNITKINFDLRNIEIKKPDNHTKKIMINDSIGLIMKYPNFDNFTKVNFQDISKKNVEVINDLIISCIDSIFTTEDMISAKDIERAQLEEWIDSLTSSNMEAIGNFFETMPKVVGNVKYKCSKCGKDHDVEITGIHSFLI